MKRTKDKTFGRRGPAPRLLVVSQVYRPSHDAISQLLGELAEGLIQKNIEVQVLTSATNYMTGHKLPTTETLDGVKVWRVPSPPVSKLSSFGKMVLYGSFLLQSSAVLAFLSWADVVMVLSTPPLLAWTSFLFKWGKTKGVFVAQDVYPELPIKMGYLKGRLVREILSTFDKATLSNFSSIVVLGERMKDEIVKKGISPERVAIIENWQAGPDIHPTDGKLNSFIANQGLEGLFVVQYSGNMGVAHDLSSIVDAARILKDHQKIKFVLIGDGKRRPEVESAVKREGLSNVLLLPYQPLELIPQTLTAAHVSLVSLRPELEGLAVPSKLYGILAAGTPVIFIGDTDGEVARVLRRGTCGLTVQNGAELAQRILELQGNEAIRCEMAKNARLIYEKEFARERALDKYERLICSLHANGSGTAA